MLPPEFKMHSAAEFRRTTRYGVRAGSSTVVVHLYSETPQAREQVPNQGIPLVSFGGPHCGLVVSKKVGNAVTRHRLSRVLRHAILPHLQQLDPSYRIVIRALPGIRTATHTEIAADIHQGIEKCQRKLARRQAQHEA
ncbi:MAG: ribonuclease P protein component [Corynebacterium sp.]|nr:ribonuclease P protein component [Corynebacterium sp.]